MTELRRLTVKLKTSSTLILTVGSTTVLYTAHLAVLSSNKFWWNDWMSLPTISRGALNITCSPRKSSTSFPSSPFRLTHNLFIQYLYVSSLKIITKLFSIFLWNLLTFPSFFDVYQMFSFFLNWIGMELEWTNDSWENNERWDDGRDWMFVCSESK